jgi:hypothetical protein
MFNLVIILYTWHAIDQEQDSICISMYAKVAAVMQPSPRGASMAGWPDRQAGRQAARQAYTSSLNLNINLRRQMTSLVWIFGFGFAAFAFLWLLLLHSWKCCEIVRWRGLSCQPARQI